MTTSDEREYKLLINTSRDFAKKILLPHREENDRYPLADMDEKIMEKAYELDFFHVWLPEELGGFGGHLKKLVLILENIAETDAGMAVMILINAMAQEIILQAGEGKALADICTREKSVHDFLIAFPAFTNPFETSSVANARKKGDTYILNGETPYVVLGNISGQALVYAKIEGDDSDSFFLVDLKAGSVRTGDPVISLGLHACPVCDVCFHDTEAMIIGEKGKAPDYFNRMYGTFMLAGASIAAGIMRGAFDDALAYCRNRVQGGRPIGNWSELQLMLSHMALTVKNAETMIACLCEGGAGKGTEGDEGIISASIPIFDQARDVTSSGIQALGGYGYMEDYSQEKRFRDAQHLQSFLGRATLKKLNFLKSFYKLAS
ncbi:MAG: acyl-CoA/acyl-ACP dehydrogenase [Proteobacteria bacterium]|nr:acyl-CoA/acyl-ACP dehydrogenase [Pseudomonadota bacterium]